jgi:hypothetical protein
LGYNPFKEKYDFANYVDYVQKKGEQGKQSWQEQEQPKGKYRAGEFVVINQRMLVWQDDNTPVVGTATDLFKMSQNYD